MNISRLTKILPIGLLGLSLFFSACGGGSKKGNASVKSERAGINDVVIVEQSDPDKLNPITYNSNNASTIMGNIYQSLLNLDPSTLEFIPILAKSRPVITEITEGPYKGGLTMVYELRPEAKWDNGTPILASDVAFTLKAIKNPKVNAENQRPYYEVIDDIQIDPSNPRKFTLIFKEKYILAESVSAITVLPEYVYDPEKIMRKFSVKDLNDASKADALKNNADILKFGEWFNGQKFQRDKEGVVGSGPYYLEKWEFGQRVTLKKKTNWWGAAMKDRGFSAGPDKLIFEVINDEPASISAIRGERVDLKDAIASKDYLELKKDDNVTAHFNLIDTTQFSYSFIGMNMRNPKMSDKKVRRALAMLVDVDKIIKVLYYDLGRRVTSPFSYLKNYYDKDLKPIPFDIAGANKLLDEAGWKDSDNDGIRDKMINGQKVQLSLTIKHRSGDPIADKLITMIAENAKQAGVNFTAQPREWTVLLNETTNHDFEMMFLGWSMSPNLDDPKQVWHTSSYNGGSNNVGFGDQHTDELIEKIRTELDETKRNALYKEFQEIVYDQQPYIFLCTPKKKMAFHKRFDNAVAYPVRPGYDATEWKLNKDFGH